MNEIKRKKEIKRELISKDLTNYLKLFIPVLLFCVIFGYIGYKFSQAENGDVIRGIILWAIYPLGILALKLIGEISELYWNSFPYIVYTIIWICIFDSIPLLIGIIILFIIITFFIVYFISIELKDRTEAVNKIYEQEIYNQRKVNNTAKYNSDVYISPDEPESMGKAGMITKETNIIEENEEDEELEYECEVCFKKISYEEWETYDMMCEDCFMDLHIDDDGNYHDEEIF